MGSSARGGCHFSSPESSSDSSSSDSPSSSSPLSSSSLSSPLSSSDSNLILYLSTKRLRASALSISRFRRTTCTSLVSIFCGSGSSSSSSSRFSSSPSTGTAANESMPLRSSSNCPSSMHAEPSLTTNGPK
eukprot:CAMPEP_0205910076 /NCGR_PEP_ID=MMETSP1325-20131115/4238_1 /ASSEMBLY_ACC=CAM_ASM_000708 /TAXON_ID=236786 /ORGANISM="Florenciella sp., Strain RCC1007" /LENGTH=130 /DNA_ID=CAMNT_0053276405 /DNA_START=22 /DNA_END=414 /DNA_ORIENTATION=+